MYQEIARCESDRMVYGPSAVYTVGMRSHRIEDANDALLATTTIIFITSLVTEGEAGVCNGRRYF
jgi:hypothetical protein